jgi:hypothetical protein
MQRKKYLRQYPERGSNGRLAPAKVEWPASVQPASDVKCNRGEGLRGFLTKREKVFG